MEIYLNNDGEHLGGKPTPPKQSRRPNKVLPLIRRDSSETISSPYQHRFFQPHDERCGHCAAPMWTLFDLDLNDPAMQFLKLKGQRLRIAMCSEPVSHGEPVFTEVDGDGKSTWLGDRKPPDPMDDLEAYRPDPPAPPIPVKPKRNRLMRFLWIVFGPADPPAPPPAPPPPVQYRPRRFHPPPSQQWMLSDRVVRRSSKYDGYIGGRPRWEQDPEKPDCPGCERQMNFVGQVELWRVVRDGGTVYAFLCEKCLISATTSQID